ncbi:MAG: hypothetical protein R3A47_11245 [Polyangiales bacterium]
MTRDRHRVWLALSLCVLGLSISAHADAETLEETFNAANRASAAGRFDEAESLYERLEHADVADTDVYYNRGLNDANAGRYGHAILNFERALQVRPSDKEAARALDSLEEFLAENRAERFGKSNIDRDLSMGSALLRPFTLNTLSAAMLMLAFTFFGAMAISRFDTGRVRQQRATTVAIIVGPLLVLAAIGFAIKSGAFRDGELAVVVQDGPLLQSPDSDAQPRGTVAEGQHVEALDERQGYRLIRLPNGKTGWIGTEGVGVYGYPLTASFHSGRMRHAQDDPRE